MIKIVNILWWCAQNAMVLFRTQRYWVCSQGVCLLNFHAHFDGEFSEIRKFYILKFVLETRSYLQKELGGDALYYEIVIFDGKWNYISAKLQYDLVTTLWRSIQIDTKIFKSFEIWYDFCIVNHDWNYKNCENSANLYIYIKVLLSWIWVSSCNKKLRINCESVIQVKLNTGYN